MTPQERKQRKQERIEKRKARELALPYAELQWSDGPHRFTLIKLDAGEERCLEIRKSGPWWKDKEIEHDYVPIRDIKDLADFIRALVARYNHAVQNLNQTASQIRMLPL